VGVPLPTLLILFVGSGAAALIYETVWLQLLQLVIGSSAVSVGILLGTFMGGMCAGSLWLPRAIGARRHPLRVYAALELGIGACGLILPWLMPIVGHVYFAGGGDGASGLILRCIVAGVCLLPPTILMGATLPAVSRWVDTTPEGISWLGWFYAGNIAGAVAGCLASGFYLLRYHDMLTASLAAVGVNIVVAALAWTLASRSSVRLKSDATPASDSYVASGFSRTGTTGEPGPSVASGFSRTGTTPIYLAIALSGFAALVGEVIWTRLIGLLFGATVYTFSIVLAAFLIGLGTGSASGAALARHVARPRLALAGCQLLAAASIAWTARKLAVSFPSWPITPTLSPGFSVDFEMDFVRTLWAVLPPAFCWGASFPLALAAVAPAEQDSARLVGRVYAVNTIGAVAGALAASLLLVAWIGTQRAEQVMILSALLAALASVVAVRSMRAVGASIALALLTLTVLDVWLIARVPPVPGLLIAYGRFMATVQDQAGEILYSGEGLHSSIAVSRLPNGRLGYHNAGKIQASSEPQDMRLQRMLGHLTTLVPPRPRSVLVIGCGAGVTAGAVSVDPRVERVTIVEIEPLVPRVAAKYFGAENHHVVDNPKVQVRVDDARHFLLTSKEKFDAITSDPLDPWVKGAATLYTREFFEAARAHLEPGGVVTLFVQLYESTPEAVKSEIATFFTAFPDGVIAGNTFRGIGYDTVLLGQAGRPQIDVDAMEARLHDPAFAEVARSLKEVGVGSAVDLLASYAGRATDLQPWLRDAAINHDGDLRLQYLAGVGLNANEGDRVYAEILKYRRYPDDLFVGSESTLAALRGRITRH
jgi:spermidine synthase